MYKTRNDLPKKTREQVARILNARLADSVDLMMQGKQAHWNVKGANFIALHELFDKIVEESEEWIDEIAERAVALGGTAYGTVRVAAKNSKLKEYPLAIASGAEHVDALSDALAAYGKSIRAAIDATDKLDDADTADLFTGISRAVDKYLWFVEAHAQK